MDRQCPHYATTWRARWSTVCYQLWEGSWETDAVVVDREAQIYADPEKVHGIDHHGRFFDVPGVSLVEPSPQRSR